MNTITFRLFLSTGFACAVYITMTASSQAQNYINAREYANPNVLIDLSVIEKSEEPTSETSVAIEEIIPPAGSQRAIPTPQGMVYPVGQQPTAETPAEMVTEDGKIRLNPPSQKKMAVINEAPEQKADSGKAVPKPAKAPIKKPVKVAIPEKAPPTPITQYTSEAAFEEPPEQKIATSAPVPMKKSATIPQSNIVEHYAQDTASEETLPHPDEEELKKPLAEETTASTTLEQDIDSGKTTSVETPSTTAIAPKYNADKAIEEKKEDSGVVYDLASNQSIHILFEGNSADISAQGMEKLKVVAKQVQSNPKKRIQLKAFADSTPATASSARRLSLTRALKIRGVLMQHGLRATQMDVRALGAGTALESSTKDGLSPNRVDIILMD